MAKMQGRIVLAVFLVASFAAAPVEAKAAWRWQDARGNAHAVVVDPAGDVVAVGSGLTLAPSDDVFKLDGSTGEVLWSQGFGVHAFAVATDAAGEVFVAGTDIRDGETIYYDFAVVRIDTTTGAEVWRTELDGDGTGSGDDKDEAFAVAVDSAGGVYAAGYFTSGQADEDFAVAKLDAATGDEVWRVAIDGSSFDRALSLVLDGTGGVIAAGQIVGASRENFAVVKLSAASGAEIWRQVIDGSEAFDDDRAVDVAVDSSGDVYAVGRLVTGADNGVVVRLSGASGAEIWRSSIPATAPATSSRPGCRTAFRSTPCPSRSSSSKERPAPRSGVARSSGREAPARSARSRSMPRET
jgi:outer membrane protein assembly factor BamB